jgi:hypothetical protein
MDEKLTARIREKLAGMGTDELRAIWRQKNSGDWTPFAIETVANLLRERGIDPSSLPTAVPEIPDRDVTAETARPERVEDAQTPAPLATRPAPAGTTLRDSGNRPTFFDVALFNWYRGMKGLAAVAFGAAFIGTAGNLKTIEQGFLLFAAIFAGMLVLNALVMVPIALLKARATNTHFESARCPSCSVSFWLDLHTCRQAADEKGQDRVSCPSCGAVAVFDVTSLNVLEIGSAPAERAK